MKPDRGDETAALLRVLIYTLNNTALGDNVPPLPLWTGPPSTMVHVQAILFASLVISLLSAFLAMLGKQWLNRYESTDMRGSAAERSHSRQRKLDGIVAWYFNHVMESLSLMLQAALLLLGCALSWYLWDISITVALVVVGITSVGVASYLFIVVTGAVFEDCPYQTPGSRILHHLGSKFWNTIHPITTLIPRYRPPSLIQHCHPFVVEPAALLAARVAGCTECTSLSGRDCSGERPPTCDASRGRSRHHWTKPSTSRP